MTEVEPLSEVERQERRDWIIAQSLEILERVPSGATTEDEFKDIIYKEVKHNWAKNIRPLGLVHLNRKFVAAGKKFGGLKLILQKLLKEGRVVPIQTHKNVTVLLTMTDYEAAVDLGRVMGVDAIQNMCVAYHDKTTE